MKTMKGYHNLYLNCVISWLADVYEKIINSSLKNYELCSNHYLSVPALNWNAILNKTNVELERISYADMYLLFERNMRRGVSCIPKRYSKAKNKYLKCYDQEQKSKHIIYLDAQTLKTYIFMAMLRVNFFQQGDLNG